ELWQCRLSCSVLRRLDWAATTAAITEHYNRNQDRAEDETTGSGVRLRKTKTLLVILEGKD
ncbi:MAG: hypothetical protein ACK5PB_04540, partial [Pirellula sp.]